MPTTPLEREILTHYATAEGPYLGGPQNWTGTHFRIVQRFVELGLLVADPGPGNRPQIRPDLEALQVYMAALAAVPLPQRRWLVDSPPAAGEPRDTGAGLEARVAELELKLSRLQAPQGDPRRSRYESEED